jgi:Tfp pilus assembly PilM family ATPase
MSRFTDAFPVPRFLAMPAVGLSLTDEAVRFVQFDIYRNKVRLARFGTKPLPPGTIRFGEIKDAPALITVLKELQKEYGLSFVRTALPEEKAYLFDVTTPYTPETNIQDAVAFKLEENVPLSPDQVVFGSHIIGGDEVLKKNPNTLDIAVSVYPADMISMYTEVLQTAGLQPISFEIESQAIARAVVEKSNFQDLLIINIRPEKTEFYIVSSKLVRFSSNVTIGTMSLFESVSGEQQKRAGGQKQIEPPLQRQNLTALIHEAQKLFSYWQTYKHGSQQTSSIQSVVVCGLGSTHERLVRMLGENLGVPATAGNVWANAFSLDEYIPPITFEESINYTSAIGLALPEGDYRYA